MYLHSTEYVEENKAIKVFPWDSGNGHNIYCSSGLRIVHKDFYYRFIYSIKLTIDKFTHLGINIFK